MARNAKGQEVTIPDLSQFTQEEKDRAYREIAMKLAPQLPFSPMGYKAHYTGIFSHTLPSFAWDWIQEFFEYYTKGVRRFCVKAHRGATKSTVWTIGFATYYLATHPSHGILIVQKSDTAAGKTSAFIADAIENNIGWRTMYPHLTPDKSKRWAFEGYDIMDTRIPYGEWRQSVADERPKDNSFVGYGWSNGGIVGMHPRLLLVDDILDEENTRSSREMSAVASTMKGNVLQTLNRPPEWDHAWDEPLAVFSYTPWYKDDFYAYVESTGLYHVMETPLISPVEEGSKGSFEWRGKHWKCAWDVRKPAELIESKLAEWGEMDFARMQMLDLTRAEGINLKREWLHEFPYEKVSDSWPVYMGVDYASSADKIKDDKHDYFTIAIGRVIPAGGVVLLDGFRGKLSQGEAEEKVKSIAALYPQLNLIGFEKLGKGYDAMHNLINSRLPIVPCPREGEGKKSKGERFERAGGLGPLFQFSKAWISDRPTPFLEAFREEWAAWPNGKHDDTLDAVYWLLYVAQGFLMAYAESEDLGIRGARKKSGFATLAKQLEGR
jgi:hypothetical protein